MSNKSPAGRRKKLPVILLILLLLTAVTVFGRPAVVSFRYSQDDLKLRYALFNPSFREVGFAAVLYDEEGNTAPGNMTFNLILTNMNLGIGSSFLKFSQPLPAGEYTLKVTLSYRYFGKEVSETVSCPFTVE